LKLKEVKVQDRRYVVCLNEEERRKDARDRQAILASLAEQLRHGDKSLVGNKGYRRCRRSPRSRSEFRKRIRDAPADGASTPETGAKMLFHGRRMVKEGQGGPFDSDE
jgi:hypothetical protein